MSSQNSIFTVWKFCSRFYYKINIHLHRAELLVESVSASTSDDVDLHSTSPKILMSLLFTVCQFCFEVLQILLPPNPTGTLDLNIIFNSPPFERNINRLHKVMCGNSLMLQFQNTIRNIWQGQCCDSVYNIVVAVFDSVFKQFHGFIALWDDFQGLNWCRDVCSLVLDHSLLLGAWNV